MPRYLGQHFLNNPAIVTDIVNSSQIDESTTVLEIGPGGGVLTEELCAKAKRVLSIELDEKLADNLKEKFANQKNLELIFADILQINLPQLLKEREIKNYKVVANIPYYITSKIIRLFLETSHQPESLTLMVQKEVAQRIVAKPGQMSKLSASVQYYAQAEILFAVKKENFDPPPEVDSSVIKIFNLRKIDKDIDKQFFKIVRAGFCARRKTLINNLSNSLHIDKQKIAADLATLGLSPQTRAQELSIENWLKLSQLL